MNIVSIVFASSNHQFLYLSPSEGSLAVVYAQSVLMLTGALPFPEAGEDCSSIVYRVRVSSLLVVIVVYISCRARTSSRLEGFDLLLQELLSALD